MIFSKFILMQTFLRAISKTVPAWYSSFPKAFSTYGPTYPGKEGSPLKLGQMTFEQLKTSYEWAAKDGWYICKGDSEAIFEYDPKGFFAGEINGEFVCNYMAFKYEDYCFLSLTIVKDEYRGQGYGYEIENYARDLYYKDSATVCVDLMDDKIERYVKMGYKDYTGVKVASKIAEGKMDKDLVDVRSVPIEEIEAYDLNVFGYKRPNYVKALLNQPSNKGLAMKKNGKLCGFALLKELLYQPGYVISPLMADDKETAGKLLDGLESYIPGEELTIGVFDSPISLEILKEGNWKVFHDYVRMLRGKKPKIDMNKLIIGDNY